MLAFIRNYLSNRSQRVVVGGKYSSSLSVISGVPQGSILGPLLFVLFINDITECVNGECKIALYADDLKLWSSITGALDHVEMQSSVDNLYNWSISNKMKFHPNKCKVISTHSSRCESNWGQLPYFLPTYDLGGVTLDNVCVQRDLGILVNNHLTWTNHTDHILERFTERFNLVRRTAHFVYNPNQRRTLFISLVRSLLEHCSPIWAPYQVGILNSLEAAQKRSIKWIYGISHLTSWNDETYFSNLVSLNILPIHIQFSFNDMKFFYKVLNSLVPVSLPNYLHFKSSSDITYTTRSNINVANNSDYTTLYCSVKPNSAVFRNSFFHRSYIYWNSLPITIRQLPTYSSFCYHLKKHLFSSMHSLSPNTS